MATVDDGVTNLQRFVAHLVMATGALEKAADHFKQSGQKFSELDGDVGEEGGGLNDELEELDTTLDTGSVDARDGLSELAQAATEGEGTVADAQADVENAVADVEERTATMLADLAEAHGELTHRGFEAVGQELDEAQQALVSVAAATEQALSEFESATGTWQAEVGAAWDAAEGELDEAISDLAEGESEIGVSASEGLAHFQSAAGGFEQQCADLESDVDVIYDALDAAVEEQGREWEQEAQRMTAEAVASVQSGMQRQLAQPAALVEDEALVSLAQEYSSLAGVLDGAAATAGDLQPLADELAKCQSVVGHIDELLNAMAG